MSQSTPPQGSQSTSSSTANVVATIEDVLANNHRWAATQQSSQPDFFKTLSAGQAPQILWFGCSDSRVPESVITQAAPGDIFVHRNIANVVRVKEDLSSLAVLAYAVGAIKVKNVIVCGHTSCGGCVGALSDKSLGILDPWLKHLKDLKTEHADEFSGLEGQAVVDKLVELNVRQSQLDIANSDVVKEAWKNGQALSISGFVYDLKTGLLEEKTPRISSDKDL